MSKPASHTHTNTSNEPDAADRHQASVGLFREVLVDESADARLADYLVAQGHDAIFVAHSYRPGMTDVEILALAHEEKRVLITDDRDFGELVFRYDNPHAGVIFFRLRDSLLSTRLDRLAHILDHYADRLDQFLVVTEARVRVA